MPSEMQAFLRCSIAAFLTGMWPRLELCAETAKATYHGWRNCCVISNGAVRAVICGDTGGRLICYALNGQNVLWEDERRHGDTNQTAGQAVFPGGYQLDVLPWIPKDTAGYAELWSGPAEVRITGDYGVEVHGSTDSPLGFSLSKAVTMDPKTGNLEVIQRVTNHSAQPQRLALWDRTWTVAPDYVFFPLHGRGVYENGWDFTENSKRWRDLKEILGSGQITVRDGIFIVDYKGLDCQIVSDCEAGWLAWVRGTLMYVKRFGVAADATYPWEGGGNLSVYMSSAAKGMVELEPASPLYDLKPGETRSFTETWEVRRISAELRSAADVAEFARKAFRSGTGR